MREWVDVPDDGEDLLRVDHPRLAGRVVESVAVEMVDDEPQVVPEESNRASGTKTE